MIIITIVIVYIIFHNYFLYHIIYFGPSEADLYVMLISSIATFMTLVVTIFDVCRLEQQWQDYKTKEKLDSPTNSLTNSETESITDSSTDTNSNSKNSTPTKDDTEASVIRTTVKSASN